MNTGKLFHHLNPEAERKVYEEIAGLLRLAGQGDPDAMQALRARWQANTQATATHVVEVFGDYKNALLPQKTLRPLLRAALAVVAGKPAALPAYTPTPAARPTPRPTPIYNNLQVKHVTADPYLTRHKTVVLLGQDRQRAELPLNNRFSMREHGPVYNRTKWTPFYRKLIENRPAGGPIDRAIKYLAAWVRSGEQVILVDHADSCHAEEVAAAVIAQLEQGLPKVPHATGSTPAYRFHMDDKDDYEPTVKERNPAINFGTYWELRDRLLGDVAGPVRFPRYAPIDVDYRRIYLDRCGVRWYEVEDLDTHATLATLNLRARKDGAKQLVLRIRTINRASHTSGFRKLHTGGWEASQNPRKRHIDPETGQEIVELEWRRGAHLDDHVRQFLATVQRHYFKYRREANRRFDGVTSKTVLRLHMAGIETPEDRFKSQAETQAESSRFDGHDYDLLEVRGDDALESALCACGGDLSAAELVTKGEMDIGTAAVMAASPVHLQRQARPQHADDAAKALDLVLRRTLDKDNERRASAYATLRVELLDELRRGKIDGKEFESVLRQQGQRACRITRYAPGTAQDIITRQYVSGLCNVRLWTPAAHYFNLPAITVEEDGLPVDEDEQRARFDNRHLEPAAVQELEGHCAIVDCPPGAALLRLTDLVADAMVNRATITHKLTNRATGAVHHLSRRQSVPLPLDWQHRQRQRIGLRPPQPTIKRERHPDALLVLRARGYLAR